MGAGLLLGSWRLRLAAGALVWLGCLCLAIASMCLFPPVGKRRYDRKQSGYGGQTKPIFRKKVSAASLSRDIFTVLTAC